MSRRPRKAGPTQPRPTQPPSAPARRWTERVRAWHVAAGLALLHLVLSLATLDPTLNSGGDNAAYLALAQSLLERGTYQELWEPAMRPHTQYPPAWPLLLAGAMSVGIKPWVGFKLIVTAFSAAAVGLSYLWARRASTPGVALAAGVLLAVGPGVVDLSHAELSDVPFWCFTMLALWSFARAAEAASGAEVEAEASPREGRMALTALAVASLGVLLAYATRSAGAPLVAAAAGWLAWRWRWRGLALFGAIVGPYALGWWVRGRLVGGGGYVGHLWHVDPYQPGLGTVTMGGMIGRIGRNVVEYTGDHLPYLLVGGRMTPMAWTIGVAVAVLAATGWGMRLRRTGVAELWLPLYMGLVLIWPAEWSGERFLLPVLPMLLVCAAEVVRLAGRRINQPVLLGAGLAAVLVAGGVPRTAQEFSFAVSCRQAYGPQNPYPCLPEPWQDYMNLAAAVGGRLPPGAAVLARKPTLFWAQTGHPSRPYPFSPDPDTLIAAARQAGARFVLVDYLDNMSVIYLAPVLMQRPHAFCVVQGAGTGRATMMAIHPDAERVPNVRGRPGNETATIGFAYCNAPAPVTATPPAP